VGRKNKIKREKRTTGRIREKKKEKQTNKQQHLWGPKSDEKKMSRKENEQ
jgi:hypothetical protein